MKKTTQGALAFFFGLALMAIVLILVFSRPELSVGQEWVIRVVMALAAAGFAAFIPGFLQVQWGPGIKAGGALAVFVLIYLVNPPERLNIDPRPSFDGSLGKLQTSLAKHVSYKEFHLILDRANQDQLEQFWVVTPVTGDDWTEVTQKICELYSVCLACDFNILPEGPSAIIRLRAGTHLTRVQTDPPRYTCGDASGSAE